MQQVFDKLVRQQSTADAGAVGRITTSSSVPFSGGAAAVNTLGTGDNSDAEHDEAKMIANISSLSPRLPGCPPPLWHVSSVTLQTSYTTTTTNTTTYKTPSTVDALISLSRKKSFRKNSSETCDEIEEDTKRTQPQHDRDNKAGMDCERAAKLLEVAGGDMTGKNMDIEVSLHLDGDQAGADLDLDMMQPQKAAMQVCVYLSSCDCWRAHHDSDWLWNTGGPSYEGPPGVAVGGSRRWHLQI